MADKTLYDPLHEKFAQLIASGKSAADAAEEIGRGRHLGSTMLRRPHIARRVETLKQNAARRAEVTRVDIIEGVLRQMALAEKLGQCAAALKGSEMLGKELHRMFVDRKEVGAAGDFDNKTEEELKNIISDELKAMGLEVKDLSAQTEDDSHDPPETEKPAPTNEGSGAVN